MAAPVRRQPAQTTARQPAGKPSTAGPMVTIPLLVLVIGLLGWLIYRVINRETTPRKAPEVVVEQKEDDTAWREIQKKIGVSLTLYRETMALRENEEMRDEFKKKHRSAMDAHNDVLESYDTMTAPLRDKNGRLPSEYSGYSGEIATVSKRLHDLIKVSPMD